MTNYEKIKNMSIDEMENAINNGYKSNTICDYCIYKELPCHGLCIHGVVYWLNSEVEE